MSRATQLTHQMGYACSSATYLPCFDDAGSAGATRKRPKALSQAHARDHRWCGDCTLTQRGARSHRARTHSESTTSDTHYQRPRPHPSPLPAAAAQCQCALPGHRTAPAHKRGHERRKRLISSLGRGFCSLTSVPRGNPSRALGGGGAARTWPR